MSSETGREHIVERLIRDVEATVGPAHVGFVVDTADFLVSFNDDLSRYRDRLVEAVQQYFHDVHVDTTWPTCPRHPNHPLWLHGESWLCERDDVPVARLGELEAALNRGSRQSDSHRTTEELG
jgi:hypothetical protein